MKKLLTFLKREDVRIIASLIFFIPAFILERLEIKYVSFALFLVALLISGIPVFISAVRGILRRDLLDEKFLMSIASIGAFIVGENSEGCAVMIFFLIGEYFEHRAVAHSRKSIQSLMSICPDTATVFVDGEESVVDADEVEVGDVVIIRPGERVPVDAVIISGNADVDTSHLTGEALPVSVSVGDEIKGGSVITSGILRARALRVADESASSRILELVSEASERKSKTENFITKFSHYYTPIVVALALLLAVVPPLFKLVGWSESIYRALIFLVTSCPCALVISVPMAFFGGIGASASLGILFKGGATFSSLANADTFVFDKTGTLTNGKFAVTSAYPRGVSQKELLYYASSAEYISNHPIAECIKSSHEAPTTPTEARELSGRGVIATVDGHTVLVGNRLLMTENGIDISLDGCIDGTVFVSLDGSFIGSLAISDTLKDEAGDTVARLKSLGANYVAVLSGDKRENVLQIKETIGIDEAFYELLPEQKYEKLGEIIDKSKNTVYVGDGINDTPSIALADVGISMGELGSDSTVEASDVVIMSDNLAKIPTAVKIARKTVRISIENIIFALTVKALILILGAFGFAGMWHAVFADVGVSVIAILNSLRTLRHKEKG